MNLDIEIAAKHFVAAAIWADAPEGTHPRATKEAEKAALELVKRFSDEHCYSVGLALDVPGYTSEQFGHDLYMTFAGHGVGFWSRDELDEGPDGIHIGDYLSDEIRNYRHEGGWFTEPHFYRGWMYM